MPVTIAGLATALPEHRISQDDAAAVAADLWTYSPEQLRIVTALYRRSGVRGRHSVVLEASSGPIANRQTFYSPRAHDTDRGPRTAHRMATYATAARALAVLAANRALEAATMRPESITQLITVSCSGFSAPGFDLGLVCDVPLAADVGRTHVGFMGCHGALNGLRVARGLLAAEPHGRVLLVAVELCTLHHYYGWDPQKIVANALFADGAAAMVLTADAPRAADAWELAASGSCVVAGTEHAMSWSIGDAGFEMTLSPDVPDLITAHLPGWIRGWLRAQGLALEQVGSWAVHPGGPRILGACVEALGLPADALEPSQSVLARFGNMSSPTVLFVLRDLAAQNAPRPCVCLGFGPGLTIEATLWR